jgi:hypothetical protein
VQVADLGGGNYRIAGAGEFPWEGTATFPGGNLVGDARFLKSRATVRVEGTRQADGSFAVRLVFRTGDQGEPTNRIDQGHVWFPSPELLPTAPGAPTISSRYHSKCTLPRVITLADLGNGSYRISELASQFPYEGTATFPSGNLLGEARFLKSRATIRIEGDRRPDGGFDVRLVFLTGDQGERTNRVDRHVWFPVS